MKKYLKRTVCLLCAASIALGTAAFPSFAGEGNRASVSGTEERSGSAADTGTVVQAQPVSGEQPEDSGKTDPLTASPESLSSGSGETEITEDADSSLTASADEEKEENGAAEREEVTEASDSGTVSAPAAARRHAPAASPSDTVAQPGDGEHLSDELNIPVNAEGLPTEGLLVQLQADTTGKTDQKLSSARLFIRFNPCGLKSHNSQPSNYNDGALCVAEYLFKKSGDSYIPVKKSSGVQDNRNAASITGTGKEYRQRAVESYGDTSDLWHAFSLTPGEADVAAFVPMGISQNTYTGAASQFCMRYEAALENEQNWTLEGGPKISGGYLALGAGETDHGKKAQDRLDLTVKPVNGGNPVTFNYGYTDPLSNAGLELNLDSLPDSGLPGRMMLHLAPPSGFENGEGGFGFVSSKTYRDAGPQVWKMPVDGKSGLRVRIERWQWSEKDVQWVSPAAGKKQLICEVPSDGTDIDLSSMGLEEGDRITVLPYLANLSKVNSSVPEPTEDKSTQRFYSFKWSLKVDGVQLALSSPDTSFSSSEDTWYADQKISDSGCKRQAVSVRASADGQSQTRCRIGADNLPDYGLHIFRNGTGWSDQDSSPKVRVIPEQSADNSYYAAEWYKANGTSYSLVSCQTSQVTKTTTLYVGGPQAAGADLVVVRRFYPKGNTGYGENAFTAYTDTSGFEMKNSKGEAVCPQSGRDSFRVFSRGITMESGKNGSLKLREMTYADGTKVEESPVTGDEEQMDLSDDSRKLVEIFMGSEETDTVIRSNPDSRSAQEGFDGLPVHAFVVKNCSCDTEKVKKEVTTLPEINVGLGLPAGADPMTVEAHLYRYNGETKKWEKVDKAEDASDWVNGENGSNLQAGLNPDWSYGIHAHLKDQEAVVVIPKTWLYKISYSVSVVNHDDFDVLPDYTSYPQSAVHPSRHYFYGLYENEDPDAQKGGEMIEIGTVHKNVDSGTTGQAEPLTNVRPLKVSLFDYDFGKKEDFILSHQTQQLHFSYDPRNNPDTEVNTWHDKEYTGIVKNSLSPEGLPVFNYTTPFSLFDRNGVSQETGGGTKTVYPDVDFDFVYDAKAKSYSYSSGSNAACFDAASGHITQYSAPIGIDSWDEKSAGFFPFNSFSDQGYWGTKAKKTQGVYMLDEKKVNYHFGLSMTHDFYIPDDRKSADQKDLIFNLSGDDDVWLFIDGKLALDLGGIHEACDGILNFSKGTWSKASSLSPWNTSGSYQTPSTSSGKMDASFLTPGKHTFSVFYLERGSTLSDLRMNFNLPLEPAAELIHTGAGGIGVISAVGTLMILMGGAYVYLKRKTGAVS